MAHKVKLLGKRLDDIAGEKNRFHLAESAISDSWKKFHEGRETISIIDESEVVGRKEDKENIIRLVLNTNIDEEKNVSVIPVVGFGGLGKTTLVQLVFNDSRVAGEHFDLRIWVCVSVDFRLEVIGKKILSETDVTCDDHMSSQAIAKRVAEKLKDKRFLLVLDDVWSEDQSKWDQMKVLFKQGKRGSKILVTTRSEKVAKIMGTTISEPYSSNHLSDTYCWDLFKRNAFAEDEANGNQSLEEIGKQIVQKCGGVPLAAIALGRMMLHVERTDAAWSAVRDNEIWELEDDKEILPSLRLSYIQMPSGLKHCFAYCSIFPKDHQIDKDNLINQWIALGFISTGVTGSQYFNYLLSMSFLQELRENRWTRRLECKMHDLVHDLARSVADGEVSIVEGDHEVLNAEGDQAIEIPRGCRYLSSSKPTIPVVVTGKLHALHLRQSAFPRMLNDAGKCLRVLHLQCRSMSSQFLHSLKGFKQLRYLDLSGERITAVPESLSGLHCLQTLNLSNCANLYSLPSSIAELQSLENLDLSGSGLRRIPKFHVGFQNLQSLNFDRCVNLTTLHESIGRLTKLRRLSLRGCFNLQLILADSLSHLQSLEYLNLGQTPVLALPEDICSIGNLQTLCLCKCKTLQQLPNSIGMLQNLKTLDLSGCSELLMLPDSLSWLQSLQYLNLQETPIWALPEDIGSLEKLQTLCLRECKLLQQLPISVGKLQNLRSLDLSSCSELQTLPPSASDLLNLEKLDIKWCRKETLQLPQGIQKMAKLRHLLNKDVHSFIPRGLGKLTNLLTLECFTVGKQGNGEHEYASIAELQQLDQLRGQLEIGHLENVEQPEEAKSANLERKHKLRALTLSWHSRHGSKDDEEVLESLQPHRNLEALTIQWYMGKKYPSWMISNSGDLVKIELYRCQSLPTLGRLPCLKTLTLEKVNVRQIGSEFYGGNEWATPFPALEELNLEWLDDLEEWLTTTTVDDNKGSRQVSAYPRLARLLIHGCQTLRPQPCLPTSLVYLGVFWGSAKLMESSLGPSSVAIGNSYNLPDNMPSLPNLQDLHIYRCEDLITLPEWLGDLRWLQSVTICDCRNLTSLPTALQQLGDKLCITECPALERGGMPSNTSKG